MNLGVRFEHSTAKSNAADAPANAVAPDLASRLAFRGTTATFRRSTTFLPVWAQRLM